MKEVTEPRRTPEKTLTDRVKNAVEEVLEALGELVRPEPEYVPVRVRAPRGPVGPRRR